MTLDYDLNEVVRAFLLLRLFTNEFRDNPVIKMLVAEIGQGCVDAGSNPVQLIATGVMYGIVLGIFVEQERVERQRRIQ